MKFICDAAKDKRCAINNSHFCWWSVPEDLVPNAMTKICLALPGKVALVPVEEDNG